MHERYTEAFEVHLRRAGAWTVDHVGLSASEARALGAAGFRRAGVDGMRILRCRTSKVTGSVTEDLVVERVRVPPPPDTVVGSIDEAPTCTTVDDLLRPATRLVLHRLFQGWLRSQELGVTECLLSPNHLHLLLDNTTLAQSAIHQVSALQSAEGDDPAVWRRRMHALADDARGRSHDVASWVLERFHDDPEALRLAIEQPGAESDLWRSCGSVRAFLSPRPTRLAKAEALIDLLQDHEEPQTLNLLDTFLADYVVDDGIALEMAGSSRFLGERLAWLTAVATGRPARAPRSGPRRRHAFADALAAAAVEGRVPGTSYALLHAVDAVLRGGAPLNDGTPTQEKSAILDLVRILGAGPGFAGGPRLAARLARRFAAVSDPARDDSFLEAVDTIVLGLTDVDVQIRFLLALLNGSNSPRLQTGLYAVADQAFTLYGGLQRMARRAGTIDELIAEFDAIGALVDQAYADAVRREAWTRAVVDGLDTAVSNRLQRGEVTPGQLLRSVEAAQLTSPAIKAALVRRLSRVAGIVT